ncbi:MAG: hypothetical protein C5B60_07065 [Chloroflexi bacterium]|nr:MAG: hypothetical protein C5B60_07065 [Chloroflexota bacterium]
MMIQQAREVFVRCLKFAPWSRQKNIVVPEPEEGKVLGWTSGILTNQMGGVDGEAFIWLGPWNSTTNYIANDVVSYQGSSYIAIAPSTNQVPTLPAFWQLMAQKGADGAPGGGPTLSSTVTSVGATQTAGVSASVSRGDHQHDHPNTGSFLPDAHHPKSHTHAGDGSGTVAESALSLTDITTNNVSTARHGFTPKLPNDATKYLDGTGNYTVPAGGGGGGSGDVVGPASAVDNDLALFNGTTGKLIKSGGQNLPESRISFSDITTGNASNAQHGFLKKLPNDASVYLDGTGNFSTPTIGGGRPLNPAIASYYKDDFETGTTASGSVGEFRWFLGGTGALNVLDGELHHPGIVNLVASGSSMRSLHLAINTTRGQYIFNQMFDHYLIARIKTSTTAIIARWGIFWIGENVIANPPTTGIYFERLDTDTNWFGVCRNISSQTRVDMGVAGDLAFHRFRIRRNDATSIAFSIDGGTEQIINTNVPNTTQATFPVFECGATTATGKDIDIDFFDQLLTGMTR